MRLAVALFAPLLLSTVIAGCSGSRGLAEARQDPGDVPGDQRAVLRSTAMREASAMGSDLLETLRIANKRTRTRADARPPARFNTLLAPFTTFPNAKSNTCQAAGVGAFLN